MQLLNNIMTRSVPFNNQISDLSKDFIKKCLRIKEDDRMSWEETFKHPLLFETYNMSLRKYKLEDRLE